MADINSFINALQLSINSPIAHTAVEGNFLSIDFDPVDPRDERLSYFVKLVKGEWVAPQRLRLSLSEVSETLVNVLLLTRLAPQNITHLTTLTRGYRDYLGNRPRSAPDSLEGIDTLKKSRDLILARIKAKNMPLQRLALLTGLSLVTLNNFKNGADIKLSNFLKLCKALDLKGFLKEE